MQSQFTIAQWFAIVTRLCGHLIFLGFTAISQQLKKGVFGKGSFRNLCEELCFVFFCVLRRFSPANLTEISFRNCPSNAGIFLKTPLAKNPKTQLLNLSFQRRVQGAVNMGGGGVAKTLLRTSRSNSPTQEPPPSPFWQLTRTMVWVLPGRKLGPWSDFAFLYRFTVLLNSGGSHSPWPEFWSEFPQFMGMGVVPAPSSNSLSRSIFSTARSIGSTSVITFEVGGLMATGSGDGILERDLRQKRTTIRRLANRNL